MQDATYVIRTSRAVHFSDDLKESLCQRMHISAGTVLQAAVFDEKTSAALKLERAFAAGNLTGQPWYVCTSCALTFERRNRIKSS